MYLFSFSTFSTLFQLVAKGTFLIAICFFSSNIYILICLLYLN